MREIEVGIRYDLKNPPTFFGLDEVNALIQQGAVVDAVVPGGVLARKLGENAETAQLTISGFAVKVRLRLPGDRPEA
jgi:hypothetical protein